MGYDRELQQALAAAAAAARYVAAEYATFTPVPDAPAAISTAVDRGSQELILRHLRAAFPADGLVAEEATPTRAESPAGTARVWVVDPIDGTRGFAMKNGEFAVMVGLTDGGRVAVGVVDEPTRDRVTFAARGFGCWVRVGGGEPVRCRVTDTPDVSAAVLVTSRSKPGKASAAAAAVGPGAVVETYSAGVKLAMVARGEVDMYVNDYPGFHDWDVCAGHVLVEEAGGTVTEVGGHPLTYGRPGAKQRKGLVATNGRLHAEVVRRLATG